LRELAAAAGAALGLAGRARNRKAFFGSFAHAVLGGSNRNAPRERVANRPNSCSVGRKATESL
jgi:hypothetical protein